MDIPDDMLCKMFRADPVLVPLVRIGRCMMLLDEQDRQVLLDSLTRRKPQTDRERRILLHYALTEGIGGVLFVDALGGFQGLRPC